MKELQTIETLYKPLQPSIREHGTGVMYREVRPDIPLQQFISCFWELKTSQPLEKPFIYEVVADGCIDIFFNPELPGESYVMGFCNQFTRFPLPMSFRYLGIRFFPSVFPQLFKISAGELSNRQSELDQVLPKLAHFIKNRYGNENSFSEIVRTLNDYFLTTLSPYHFKFDSRFYKAMLQIIENNGNLRIERQLQTGMSPRQLRRSFQHYLGASPKSFSQVIRFQQFLNLYPIHKERNTNFFYDLGYFDQAHFIKDFKRFYGQTPAKILG